MNHLIEIWRGSGALKRREYAKVMSFINGIIVLYFIMITLIEEISTISPALNCLHELGARKFLITRIGYLIIFVFLGIAYLLFNIRFYPFVQSWIVSSLFRKPRINKSKGDYQKGYNRNPNRQMNITVKNKIEKDWVGNTKWEKDFLGNIKTDRFGIPIPKVTSEITQKDFGNSRSFSGTKEAYEGLTTSVFSYIFKMSVSLLLLLLSWYLSFVLGWIAVSNIQ